MIIALLRSELPKGHIYLSTLLQLIHRLLNSVIGTEIAILNNPNYNTSHTTVELRHCRIQFYPYQLNRENQYAKSRDILIVGGALIHLCTMEVLTWSILIAKKYACKINVYIKVYDQMI